MVGSEGFGSSVQSLVAKSSVSTLLALQQLTATPWVAVSSTLDVTNALVAAFIIRLGRQTESAFTAGVNFRLEAGMTVGGVTIWVPITTFTSALGSSVGSESPSAAASAGQKVISVSSTTGFAQGDVIFIQDATLANSEFARVTAITTNVSITVEENLKFAHATTATIYDQSELYLPVIDTTGLTSLRVVVDGSGAGQNFAVDCYAVTGQ